VQWPQLGAASRSHPLVILGRASLEMGNWGEAERYLRGVPIRQRTWDNSRSIAISDFLAYALVEFYPAKVYEHDGKKADAVNAYH
jgi:hypothetical protein